MEDYKRIRKLVRTHIKNKEVLDEVEKYIMKQHRKIGRLEFKDKSFEDYLKLKETGLSDEIIADSWYISVSTLVRWKRKNEVSL